MYPLFLIPMHKQLLCAGFSELCDRDIRFFSIVFFSHAFSNACIYLFLFVHPNPLLCNL